MRLTFKRNSDWPKLAWIAKTAIGKECVDVFHGPMVETQHEFCVEAVWPGKYEEGCFDQTDLVFGTGVRIRDNRVVFVSSASTTDRLWYHTDGKTYHISNSLPAILSFLNLDLIDDHNYWLDIRTICSGLESYIESIPLINGERICVVYRDNLVFDGKALVKAKKKETTPSFSTYSDYLTFLRQTAEAISQNAGSNTRKYRIKPLASLSSGYDATASAVIAKYAGCSHAVTIKQSSSYWRGSDSGETVAKYLGMTCDVYNNKTANYPFEESFWAVSGRAFLINWTQFDYPGPLCLFFSGCRGDNVWDYGIKNIPDPFSVPSVGDMGMAEFRLIKGVFHCPVPFWGITRVRDLRRISVSKEMAPWSLGGNYDRPIARRIIEDAGVPRGEFAVQKKNTALSPYFLWPYSPDAVRSFRQFLKARKLAAPPGWMVRIIQWVSTIDLLIYLNITGKYGLVKGDFGIRRLFAVKGNNMLFQWGNSELKKRYRRLRKDDGKD